VIEGELQCVREIYSGEYGVRINDMHFILYADQVLGIAE